MSYQQQIVRDTFWHPLYIPNLEFVGLPVPKILLIFGKALIDLMTLTFDLSISKWGHGSPMSWPSFLPIISFSRPSVLDIGSGTGQTDRLTDRQTDNGH